MITQDEIRERLFALSDLKYRDFSAALMPTVDKNKVIGVRIPALRKLAAEISKSGGAEAVFDSLPHEYFEENNLHAFLIEKISDFDTCIMALERFLPYVDNWATCDSMNPKALRREPKRLKKYIYKWISAKDTYTVRYAIGLVMRYYLDSEFDIDLVEKIVEIRSDEYYIKMMIAWFFATALAKQYKIILPYIENRVLSLWVHNKTIQKAVESYRISNEQKEYLRKLKIR